MPEGHGYETATGHGQRVEFPPSLTAGLVPLGRSPSALSKLESKPSFAGFNLRASVRWRGLLCKPLSTG